MLVLVALVFMLSACTGEIASAPPPGRVAAVAAAKVDPARLDGFCEHHASAEAARSFVMPPVDPVASPAPGSAATWRWVNVWATWCGPCVAEMPQLVKWRDKLKEQGHPVDLVFLSVDDKPELVQRFLQKHPELAPELAHAPRVTDAGVLPTWLPQVGLDPGVAIPLHFFLDPAGRMRCVRTGAIDPGDFDLVKSVVGGG